MAKEENKSSGYDSGPLWQWILVYVVVGGIIYGLIYYFVFAKKGGYAHNRQGQYPTQKVVSSVQSITLTTSGFAPQNITVKAGTEVVWTNNSGGTAAINSANHPTHLVYPPLNLGNFANGETLSLVFDQPGTYKYHNHLDASQAGIVVVE